MHSTPVSIHLQVNGQSYCQSILPGSSLLSLLRGLGWMGVHRACESGDCGACTVLLEGDPIHSCLYPAARLNGQRITTIEGLAKDGEWDPMQARFLAGQGFQCGFCTPGMILSARKLCEQRIPSEAQLRDLLRGNLCRCTGYQAILESIQGIPADLPESDLESVGRNVPKQDGPEIVSGQAAYTSDFTPAGLLHLRVLRSPHAHARIRAIDTTQAQALPGVVAVLTHKDVPRQIYSTAGHAEPVPDPLDRFVLDEKVRFVGDAVAAVVAESVAIAEQACQLIQVEYEILPHVLDPLAAMQPGSPCIHDEPEARQIYDASRNLAGYVCLQTGDPEQGFAAADLILENTYHLPAVQHAHLEPHVSTSWLEPVHPEGGESFEQLVVRSSTQVPFHCQRVLSEICGIPRQRIRVIKGKIGGGFGNKQEILTEPLCALATLKTGRPVQWELTRLEEFTTTNSRHAMQIRVKTGVKADGTLTAQEITTYGNAGAYGNHSQTVVFLAGYVPLGLYRCPHKRFEGFAVYTNSMPGGAFRGYGATQGTFAMESQMDEIAHKLELNPIELRLKNVIRPGDALTLGYRDQQEADLKDSHFNLIGSYGLKECFEKIQTAFSTPLPAREGSRHYGRGIALSMQGSGLSKIHIAGIKLSLQPTGRILMLSGAVDVGTGSDTTLRQIAAQVLGIPLTQIDLIAADTGQTPFDAGSYASATLFISGQASQRAAQVLRDKLIQAAAQRLQTDPGQVSFAEGIFSTPQGSLTLQELAQGTPAPIEVELHHAADESSLTFAVAGVEVAVDRETGQIELLKTVQAIDLGTAINPRICHGQVTGGTAMGIGYALSEALIQDEQGQILNPGFRYYRIPTAKDVPPMEVHLIQQADPYGPFGAKGVGEITTNCTAPAIANAVFQATGIRFRQLPLTPERVWSALGEQDKP
ncbi:molybdopterin-dependent oxidoreductase [Synechococcus sp. Nb3U1]|uniref:molybdopterin-dependent oxidoreductase n=1 Tax=Synechococcus sp. Nb3U1 TaxID=1914529 RepID=UPI001F221D54|nr:molybdopterin cofactor-binding domain-containing protein [Synechococcus sp. Nb3U1]MCF2970451.1 molybdopterin-dependent oxidoreductase [Synechococcus sp. Nb3U1]